VGDQQGLGDIITNSVTHGLGALLALAGAAFLTAASSKASFLVFASCIVFGATLVLVYVCSTLYHSLIRTPARHVLKVLDHSSIYLLIAGTYTPFTLVSLHGRVGWTLFAAVWSLAVAGVVFKSIAVERYHVLSAVVYIAMGWLVVFATGPLIHAISLRGAGWLLAGGICYTGGILFFALDSKSYFHGIWHMFVLLGSVFHYFAVLFYVLYRA
jgi:hemolysin III